MSLPVNPTLRLMQLVEKSAPRPDRPRLPLPLEAKLAEVDRKHAACYASMEDLTDRLYRVAADIDHSDITLTQKAVSVDADDDFEEDSVVRHIGNVHALRHS